VYSSIDNFQQKLTAVPNPKRSTRKNHLLPISPSSYTGANVQFLLQVLNNLGAANGKILNLNLTLQLNFPLLRKYE
jgi:hypothetical protein